MKILNSKFIITLFITILLIFGTYVAIKWAKGYRFDYKEKAVKGTGLLVANSDPKGASIFINNTLTSATDETLHLNPGDYEIRIEKEGYHPWQKNLKIEAELVRQTNAKLFPSVPNLSALTFSGASNPHPSPNGSKIAFQIASGSATTKYGIWILDLSDNLLRQSSNSIQIIQDTPNLTFSQAQLFWEPNSNQILAYFDENRSYLLDTNKLNKVSDLINIAFQLETIIPDWQQQLALQRYKKIQKLPLAFQEIATNSATLLFFSPNEEKLLYVATASAQIPENLIPPLPSINSQPQERNLMAGNIYIYDIKEDTNFLIKSKAFPLADLSKIIEKFSLPPVDLSQTLNTNQPTPTPIRIRNLENNKTNLDNLLTIQAQYSPIYTIKQIQWFPNSHHLIIVEDAKIGIMEYDNTNKVYLYSGIFESNFAYPWPNGKRLIFISSLSVDPNILPNFYSLNLE